MSCCEMKIVLKSGDVTSYKEYKNSWRGHAFIWTKIYDRYIKKNEYDCWLTNVDELFSLLNSRLIPYQVRLILLSTCDYAIIEYEKLPEYVEALKWFMCKFDAFDSHLSKWAKDCEDLLIRSDVLGICFYATSTSQDPWVIYDKDEEYPPYNINKGNKHFFVFEEMTKI